MLDENKVTYFFHYCGLLPRNIFMRDKVFLWLIRYLWLYGCRVVNIIRGCLGLFAIMPFSRFSVYLNIPLTNLSMIHFFEFNLHI